MTMNALFIMLIKILCISSKNCAFTDMLFVKWINTLLFRVVISFKMCRITNILFFKYSQW